MFSPRKATSPAWVAASQIADARDIKLMGAGHRECVRIVNVLVTFLGLVAIAPYIAPLPLGRGYAIVIALPVAVGLLVLGRLAIRRRLECERRARRKLANALAACSRESAAHLVSDFTRNPHAGFKIARACVPDGRADAGELGGAPALGGVPDAARLEPRRA